MMSKYFKPNHHELASSCLSSWITKFDFLQKKNKISLFKNVSGFCHSLVKVVKNSAVARALMGGGGDI